MSQNTEHNVRTRDEQVLQFGNDLIDLRGRKACTEYSVAERHILEAEARGAAEERAKGGKVSLPDDGPFLIVFQEQGVPNELFAGNGAKRGAFARFGAVSNGYHCRLYAVIDSSIRGDHETGAVIYPAKVTGIDVDAVIRNVSELPDRTSPDDQPDLLMVTADELRLILSEAQPANVAALEARVKELEAAVQNVLAHETAWRDLLATIDHDSAGYVEHEQDAFDRDMGKLRAAITREGGV